MVVDGSDGDGDGDDDDILFLFLLAVTKTIGSSSSSLAIPHSFNILISIPSYLQYNLYRVKDNIPCPAVSCPCANHHLVILPKR